MTIAQHPNFLRTVLLLDVATCLLTGLLMKMGAVPLAELTDIPAAVLLYAGVSLFPVAAFITLVGVMPAIPATGVWLVIMGNGAWVAASLWLMISGAISPNALGYAFIAGQAFAVAMLAGLEYAGLQRLGVRPQ
jgi:hypothetical protein